MRRQVRAASNGQSRHSIPPPTKKLCPKDGNRLPHLPGTGVSAHGAASKNEGEKRGRKHRPAGCAITTTFTVVTHFGFPLIQPAPQHHPHRLTHMAGPATRRTHG